MNLSFENIRRMTEEARKSAIPTIRCLDCGKEYYGFDQDGNAVRKPIHCFDHTPVDAICGLPIMDN